jgi:primary-amine oxidase
VRVLVLLALSFAACGGPRREPPPESPPPLPEAPPPPVAVAAPEPSAFPPTTPGHPLDPLTPEELAAVVRLVRERAGTDEVLFPLIDLREPAKDDVLAWRAGDAIPRRASAVVNAPEGAFEAELDLDGEGSVTSWAPAGGEPMVTFEEFTQATAIATAHPEMVAGLARRGFEPDEVLCLPLTAGNFFDGEAENRRLMKVPCFVLPGPGSNYYARPIEGLFATVDLRAREVLSVTDTGDVPVPEDGWGYTDDEIGERYPLRDVSRAARLAQPGGRGDDITIEGSTVRWDMWRFHLRTEKRAGVVLSLAEVRDGDAWRSVLYQAHLSEVFVPYMDPGENFYYRTYMDSGEYGFGLFLSPLRRGTDCPRTARYLPSRLHTDEGAPLEVPDALCVFERQTGDAAWRHYEVFAQSEDAPIPAEGRPWTELVVRSASQVGNYDYFIDYVFQQDGKIRIMIGSTGLDAVRGVASTSMEDPTAEADTAHGTLIAPHLVAPNHDHFFNFRLDFDVDGRDNNFMRTAIVPGTPAPDAVRRSFWVTEMTMPRTEDEASYRVSYDRPAMYHVGNMNRTGALGHHPTYMITPLGGVAYSPLDLDNDPPMQRNAYIDRTFWVTPYDPEQRYAGGRYAFQSDGSDSLPSWTRAGRSIDDTDIVVWVTLGFHHIPHMEDWPVMPTMWKGMQLAPFNFFDRNPAATVRSVPAR